MMQCHTSQEIQTEGKTTKTDKGALGRKKQRQVLTTNSDPALRKLK